MQGAVARRLWAGSDGAVGRAGGDGHTSSETGAPDWLDRGVASDRRRWAERAWIGCALVWLCGCLVHVVHVVRALRRTGLVGDWACGADASMCGGHLIVGDALCSEYAALSDLPFASLRDAGDLQGGRAFEGRGDAGRDVRGLR